MIDENAGLDRLLHFFHRMHMGAIRHELEQRGIHEIASPGILFMLYHATVHENLPGLSQKRIADMMGVAPPTVAVSIKRLERNDLLTKKADETDLRRNIITLTAKGRFYAEECLAAERAIYGQVVDGFTAEEITRLSGFCRRMIGNLQGPGVRGPHFILSESEEPGKCKMNHVKDDPVI